MDEKITDSFTQNDYEIIERDVPYEGRFSRMARYKIRFRLFRGGFSKIIKRDIMERRSSAGLLPYDPVTDCVVLIEQFRAGAIGNPVSPWLLEVVAGTLEEDETPSTLVTREAEEEANCKILDLYPICEYFVSPGCTNEYFYLYCGRIAAPLNEGIYGLATEDEDIRAFSLTVDEAVILMQEGKIKTSPAILALQWLQLNRGWLRQLWQTK